MKMILLVIFLIALCSSVVSQCKQGLTVFNQTNHVVLSSSSCSEGIDPKALIGEPTITYNRANMSESYLLMLLEAHPNNHDMFVLHWLIAGIKPHGTTLLTKTGVRNLSGYYAPINQTQYEFRLYNVTGKDSWEPVSAAERNYFLPSQWLKNNKVYSTPLALTTFTVKAFIPGPAGWVVPQYPAGSQPPVYGVHPPPAQFPPQQPPQIGQPNQHLPNYPTQPPLYPQLPASQYPAQQFPPQPVLPSGQPHPPPSYPPQYPYPSQVVPQPHHPQYPVQPTVQNPSQPNVQNPAQPNVQNPAQPTHHHSDTIGLHVQTQYNINGTLYRMLTPDRSPHNILTINSTIYTSDTYDKRFKLTRYLIIDNKSYTWRNMTHVLGKGPSVFINGTQYVPYNPSKEIHHYHYHKGSASSLNPNIVLFTFLIPSLLCIFHS